MYKIGVGITIVAILLLLLLICFYLYFMYIIHQKMSEAMEDSESYLKESDNEDSEEYTENIKVGSPSVAVYDGMQGEVPNNKDSMQGLAPKMKQPGQFILESCSGDAAKEWQAPKHVYVNNDGETLTFEYLGRLGNNI